MPFLGHPETRPGTSVFYMNCLDCAARENHFLIPGFFHAARDPFGKHFPLSLSGAGSRVTLICFDDRLGQHRELRLGRTRGLVALSGIRIPSFIPFLILSLFERRASALYMMQDHNGWVSSLPSLPSLASPLPSIPPYLTYSTAG